MLDHRFMPSQHACSLLYLAPEVVNGLPSDEKVPPLVLLAPLLTLLTPFELDSVGGHDL